MSLDTIPAPADTAGAATPPQEALVVSNAPRFRKGRYSYVTQVSTASGTALASCTHRHASMALADDCGRGGVSRKTRTGEWPKDWCPE